jgi:carbamoyltransferase
MNILGLSCFYHDSAACLVIDGEIIAAAQEERFTRKKHDSDFPQNAIHFCLKYANLKIENIDYITFYEKPFIKFERILESYIAYAPKRLQSYLMALPLWIKKKLWLPDFIEKKLGYTGKILFTEHHFSHAASAFFPSPFQHAAFITMDGVGEWTTTSFGVGQNNKIEILSEMHFPHSLGLLYSAFTYYTGFKVNSGEYKLMGLAPYGELKFVQKILDNLLDLKEDGSFKLNMKFFNYCAGLTMTNKNFEKLFGEKARKPETLITRREMDLARSVQAVTEEILLRMANHVYKETQQENLCLAGGVALNCVGNGRLLRESPFKNIWVQPAAGDAGAALGAALFTWYQHLNNNRKKPKKADFQKGSFLGPNFSKENIKQYLDSINAPYKELSEKNLYNSVAHIISQDKVVGWFQGRMEYGPRALGNRSILGDARSLDMQSKMNLKIKHRESFRPFAPSILEEDVTDYFDLKKPSPYMLIVAPVAKDKQKTLSKSQQNSTGFNKLKIPRSEIPAITHVDCSARIQTVNFQTNPKFYNLLKALKENSNCPLVINTSFNVRGEPIVCSPQDAYLCFQRTDMDYLVLENFLLSKNEQPDFFEKVDWKETYELD